MIDTDKLLEKKEVKLPKLPRLPELDVVGTKDKEVMNQLERLRLICNKCSKEWMEKRPKGYNVKYEKGNIFLINRHSPYNKKLFKCPKCRSKKNIGRLSLITIVKNK